MKAQKKFKINKSNYVNLLFKKIGKNYIKSLYEYIAKLTKGYCTVESY